MPLRHCYGISSVGRARLSQSRGREFEPRIPLSSGRYIYYSRSGHQTVVWCPLLLCVLCLFLCKLIYDVQHGIVWYLVCPCLYVPLSIYGVGGVRQLMQYVECFELAGQLAFDERARQRCVPYQVVGVHFGCLIASAREHLYVGGDLYCSVAP